MKIELLLDLDIRKLSEADEPLEILRREWELEKEPTEAAAYHEAGHAIAAWRKRLRFLEVTIEPTHIYSGRVRFAKVFRKHELENSNSDRLRIKVEDFALMCLAGPAAQRKYDSRSIRIAYHGDHEEAERILRDYSGSANEQYVRTYYKLIGIRARDFVECNWQWIELLARELLERRTMSREDFGEFIKSLGKQS